MVRADASNRLRLLAVAIERTFEELRRSTRHCEAVAVDIPIGLSEREPRQADLEARRLLAPHRASSVFPAPVRAALDASTYQGACDISFRTCGKKMSKQAYNTTSKIREVDQAMTPDPALQEWVVEIHPEVSFWALNGRRPMSHKKKSAVGKEERLHLLSQVFEDDFARVAVPRGAGRDDFLDACAAAWTAWRLAEGRAERLLPNPPLDARGLRMEMVY